MSPVRTKCAAVGYPPLAPFRQGTAKGNAIIVLMNRTPDGDTEAAMERIFERVSSDMLRD